MIRKTYMQFFLFLIVLSVGVGTMAKADVLSSVYEYNRDTFNFSFISELTEESVNKMSDRDVLDSWLAIKDMSWKERRQLRGGNDKNANGYWRIYQRLGAVFASTGGYREQFTYSANMAEVDQRLDKNIIPNLGDSENPDAVYELFEAIIDVDPSLARSAIDVLMLHDKNPSDQKRAIEDIRQSLNSKHPSEHLLLRLKARIDVWAVGKIPSQELMAFRSRLHEPGYQRKLKRLRRARLALKFTPEIRRKLNGSRLKAKASVR